MKTKNIIISAITVVVIGLGVLLAGTYFSVNNEEKQ